MKSDYRERAFQFLTEIYPYIKNCMNEVYTVKRMIHVYNRKHFRNVKVSNGSARIALITSDYVIKFEYDYEEVIRIGGCEDEVDFYEFVKQNHMEHLFAEVTPISYMGHKFYIMPRISGVGRYDDDYVQNFLDGKDLQFVEKYLYDMHSGNYGWKNGYPVIIDYALNVFFEQRRKRPYKKMNNITDDDEKSYYNSTKYTTESY